MLFAEPIYVGDQEITTAYLGAQQVLGGTPPISYEDAVLADSPIGFWPMQGPSTDADDDITGNGLNLTWHGSPTFQQAGPEGTEAVAFNGSTQRGDVGSASFPKLTDASVSMELWFRSNSAATFRTMAVWRRVSDTAAEGLLMGLNSPSAGNLRAYRLGSFRTTGTGAVNDSAWHHLVHTHDGTNGYRVYLDGALLQSGAASTSANALDTIVNFGSNAASGAAGTNIQFFAGWLCFGALYSYELSSTQVAAHYAAMSP